jgi:hypothetical protein
MPGTDQPAPWLLGVLAGRISLPEECGAGKDFSRYFRKKIVPHRKNVRRPEKKEAVSWNRNGEDYIKYPEQNAPLEVDRFHMYSATIHMKGDRVMKASVVDLRYKMNDVLKALDRNEKVTLYYRGKVKGVLIPMEPRKGLKMTEHPFFGMRSRDAEKSVLDALNDLRRPRYDDI